MSKSKKQNKSKLIRDYMQANPDKSPKEVAEHFADKMPITAAYVSTVKSNWRRQQSEASVESQKEGTATATAVQAKKRGRPRKVAVAVAPKLTREDPPAAAQEPELSGLQSMADLENFSVQDLVLAKRFLLEVGGPVKAKQALQLVSFLGQ